MKKFFRDYFSFNQVEVKGIRALLVVLICLIITYFLVPVLLRSNHKFDTSQYQAKVDSFMAHSAVDTVSDDEIRYNNNYNYSKYDKPQKDVNGNFVMRPFDPNGLPAEIWIQMGLSEKQAGVIKNYESKGGKFKTKEDVKKQFVISDDFYKKIEPFIVFAEINEDVVTEHPALSVDINHASKEDFMLINGIKDYLAEGIVKYRNRLGGFTSMEQLKEIKYLSERIYADITPHCFVTSYAVKKININLAEWTELAPHPYVGGELATQIINYRKKNGIFKNAEDFKKAGLVDEAIYSKLVPYLSFTH
jgi:competence protein ComEA